MDTRTQIETIAESIIQDWMSTDDVITLRGLAYVPESQLDGNLELVTQLQHSFSEIDKASALQERAIFNDYLAKVAGVEHRAEKLIRTAQEATSLSQEESESTQLLDQLTKL